ncbi:ComEC/Rec2 family competence protein [Nocardioides cavernaquae]|uniref:ComEC/Rec2 family competence protein n=1 Tax=Nocardioides cavernaquae TaxID=2321396 RepID=A0A3A5HBC6_9ACTN|nr:ComEC/Rec2 family competence protein [Nocardioides cavernaquae]RJS47939.1 ComEC/Rec2 family competence protein [Nocardioides cavernaquae]
MAARDLRGPALGLAAWVGGLLVLGVPPRAGWILAGLTLVVLGLVAHRKPELRRSVCTWVLVALAVAGAAALRVEGTRTGPVADLAEQRAAVTLRLRVTSDPVRLEGAYGAGVRLRATVLEVRRGDIALRVRSPVLVLADGSWSDVELGSELQARGRLAHVADGDLSALVSARGRPEVLREPGPLWRAAAVIRGGVRDAVADRGPPQRDLVPALVDGDDAGLPEQVQADFRVAGLTHLLAVSGTNLTLVVGVLLLVGKACGVRGRWLLVLGVFGIASFVLVARTEPSVVRAAAMGSVALLGFGSNGRDRGPRALGLAVLGLLLIDPWLATTVGFALSVLATAGILFLAPRWTAALSRWMPPWLAAAIAVPAAAQLACTPVVAAISGEVSLVAVLANLLAGPFVAPATVAGLIGGLLELVWHPLGAAVGWIAAACAATIIAIARHSAALATPAVSWGTGPLALAVLTVLCVAVAAWSGRLLARRTPSAVLSVGLAVVMLVPPPSPGWPPEGWVFAACDIGQGDGLVLNAGDGAAVVVDAGPDPASMDRCLDRLEIRRVPLVVLSHFHADHVDGLGGVYDGREVGEVDVTGLAEPLERVETVQEITGDRALVPAYGVTRQIGDVRLQVVGPVPGVEQHGSAADSGSGPNNASVVLVLDVRGVRMLLAGDVEPEAQRWLQRTLAGLTVDVLKVPHHGSRYQDTDWLASLGARVAVISVGADNDYGHPAQSTLDVLTATGAAVHRTDTDGDVVVVAGQDGLEVGTRK